MFGGSSQQQQQQQQQQQLLLELVPYDTVRTLRGVLANHFRQQRQQREQCHSTTAVQLFAPGGGRLEDDSAALAEVGLAPNGVVHVNLVRKSSSGKK